MKVRGLNSEHDAEIGGNSHLWPGARKPAFVFDLDGTINHTIPVQDGFPVRGRTKDSLIGPRIIECLVELSGCIDLFVATGRSQSTAIDFKKHFTDAGLQISGWIFEHGAVVAGRPKWTDTVLSGIDLDMIHRQAKKIVQEHGLPINIECYRHDHKGFLLYAANSLLAAEHLLSCLSNVLDKDFRTIVGSRKIAIIPKPGDKFTAFQANFGTDYFIAFAAGDTTDDLTLLQHAAFPLTLAGASPLVQEYINKRGGFLSEKSGHEGIAEILKIILDRATNNISGLSMPGHRLPYEEMEPFRPSRCAYLDNLFANSAYPKEKPDIIYARKLGARLDLGKKLVFETRMRDWGGEVKPLRSLLKVMVPLIPYARWRLVFRQERLGVNNLTNFQAVANKLQEFMDMPDGGPRFTCPGAPGTPDNPGNSTATLLMYDHPDDMAPWYDHAVTRLVTSHPEKTRTWFVNPMFLKIADVFDADVFDVVGIVKKCPPPVQLAGSNIMMAANVTSRLDIQIAVQGFYRLSDSLDALIIAPRVVTNTKRNQMIHDALQTIGEEMIFLSKLQKHNRPRVLFVDTYGDLCRLYANCRITYLGGGFDARKRGFDPMESLMAKVPVILGPIYDFNRIAVDSLKSTGWINVLNKETFAPDDFVDKAKEILSSAPELKKLKQFMEERRPDSLRATIEVLTGLI